MRAFAAGAQLTGFSLDGWDGMVFRGSPRRLQTYGRQPGWGGGGVGVADGPRALS